MVKNVGGKVRFVKNVTWKIWWVGYSENSVYGNDIYIYIYI